MLNTKELDEFRSMLLALRSRVQGDVRDLTDGALDSSGSSGESKSPTHIAELGTEAYEQEFALSLIEKDRGVLEKIEAAIERIGDGTFGLCEACRADGKPSSRAGIPKARLRAIPWTLNCVNCERKREELTP